MQAIGNDIIDLHHPSILEHSSHDEVWMQRHLTGDEWRWISDFSDSTQRGSAFWQIFALKEASSKAITQLGYTVPFGTFTHFEVDVERNTVLHCSGEVLQIQSVQTNPEWIHAIVARTSRPFCVPSKIISEVFDVTDCGDASDYLKDRLIMSLNCNGYQSATFAQRDGVPLIVQNGKTIAPVSFSHSGKFAAFSWVPEQS